MLRRAYKEEGKACDCIPATLVEMSGAGESNIVDSLAFVFTVPGGRLTLYIPAKQGKEIRQVLDFVATKCPGIFD